MNYRDRLHYAIPKPEIKPEPEILTIMERAYLQGQTEHPCAKWSGVKKNFTNKPLFTNQN